MEIWKSEDGSEVAVTAATWELNPKVTPQSLAQEFKRNPTKALRNYASIVTVKYEAAIKDPAIILARANAQRESPWDEVRNTYKLWFRPEPGTKYFMHFDLSRNRDATGIAVSHRNRSTRRMVVDFMHQHRAAHGKNINYGELRERYIYPLTERGFYLQLISFDQYQSAETQQVLEEKGFRVDQVSVDKSTDAYDTLIELIITDNIDYYAHRVFIEEMEELRNTGSKYDHPRKTRTGKPGSKDVADAVAATVWGAIKYELENPAEPPGKMKVIRRTGLMPVFGDERTI